MNLDRSRRPLVVLLAGTIFVTSNLALAQAPTPTPAPASTPAATDNQVEEVVVRGRKQPPGADAPKSATCEYLIANDPIVRTQLGLVALTGNALAGPRIYLPTRPPRENDYAAAPRSEPGSPIPDFGRRWRGANRSNLDSTVATGTASESEGEGEATVDANSSVSQRPFQVGDARQASGAEPVRMGEVIQGEFTVEQAIDACRATFSRGGSTAAPGRAEIARNDTTLPNGFVLFDDGRYEEALEQFKAAHRKLQHEEGGDEAALMIGKIYLKALRDKSDPKEAVVWLRRAAEGPFNPTTSMPQFDPTQPENNTAMGEAAMLLAQIYMSGVKGVAKNPAEARKWLARANEVGHVRAAKVLGDLYYRGQDTDKDLKKAAAYYREAASLGYAPAQFALGEMYYFGQGQKADLRQALGWYNEAAKLEDPNACYALAVAYDTGDGVPTDPQRAIGFYRIAALKGHVPSMTALGTYFYEGGVVAKDNATARRWFDSAAKAGDGDAMFNLAAMMMKGEGGETDRARAWVWFKLAQAKGKPEAAAAIAAIERQMSAEEKAEGAKLLGPVAS